MSDDAEKSSRDLKLLLNDGSFTWPKSPDPPYDAFLEFVRSVKKLLGEEGAKSFWDDVARKKICSILHAVADRNDIEILELMCDGLSINVELRDSEQRCAIHIFAGKCNGIEGLDLLLSHAVDAAQHVNVRDARGDTPLHYAAAAARIENVELLLERGAAIDAANDVGQTVLARAVASDCPATVRLVCERGATIDVPDSSLALCTVDDQVEVAKVLVEMGADVNMADASGNTVVNDAAFDGSVEVLSLLLDHGADVDHGGQRGESPLMQAVTRGRHEAAHLLLERGADANVADSHTGDTPLMVALAIPRDDQDDRLIAALARKQTDVNFPNTHKMTPLHLCAMTGLEEPTEILLSRGADPCFKDAKGRPPLHVAYDLGRSNQFVRVLGEHFGGNPKRLLEASLDSHGLPAMHNYVERSACNLIDALAKAANNDKILVDALSPAESKYGSVTALHLAILLRSENAISMLTRGGADLRRFDEDGKAPVHLMAATNAWHSLGIYPELLPMKDRVFGATPLIIATICGQEEALEELLGDVNAGPACEINTPDAFGYTALHYAALTGTLEFIGPLVQHGARVNEKSAPGGLTPLQMVFVESHQPILKDYFNWIGSFSQLCSDPHLEEYLDIMLDDAPGSQRRETAQCLLQLGANFKMRNPETGGTLLHLAATNKVFEGVAAEILQRPGSANLLQAFDKSGFQPLHVAAVHGTELCAWEFMRKGAAVSTKSRGSSPTTPLALAVSNGNHRVAHILLDNHAHPKEVDKAAKTREQLIQMGYLKRC